MIKLYDKTGGIVDCLDESSLIEDIKTLLAELKSGYELSIILERRPDNALIGDYEYREVEK